MIFFPFSLKEYLILLIGFVKAFKSEFQATQLNGLCGNGSALYSQYTQMCRNPCRYS